MFRKIPFTEKELKIIGIAQFRPDRPGTPIRNTPVTPRENYAALLYEKKPFWFVTAPEIPPMESMVYKKNLGRVNYDNTDYFGVDWEYVPSARGSMVRGGKAILDDANNWREKIHIPDISQWDWEAEADEISLDPRFPHEMTLLNGFWFERLLSFMDFVPAAMALIDEDQTDALKELFQALTDLGCVVVDKLCSLYPMVDVINVHDDWGAQKGPFFSQEVAYELFVPYMKQLTDRIHSWGRIATLHSCGHNEDRVEAYIDAGFDLWTPQTMNDIHALYEKYGDKIVLGVWPDAFDPEKTSEEEQRAFARKLVDDFSQPGKPAILGVNGIWALTPAFSDELYRYSRKKFMEIN